MWLGRRAGLGSHTHQMWEGLQPGMEGVCWLPSITPRRGSPVSQPRCGSRAHRGRGSAPGTEPPCAPSGCAGGRGQGEEGPVCCPLLCFPLVLPLLSSCSLQHSPALQDCSMLLFFFFSWKTGLLQGIPCSFPGSCPSQDLKSRRRMRCSHLEQCCTCGRQGVCRGWFRSGCYLEPYWGRR